MDTSINQISLFRICKITWTSCLLTIAATILFTANTNAQVTVGRDTPPVSGSVLDLGQVPLKNLGLMLPKVELANLSSWAPLTGTALDGMLVYNTSATPAPGIYVWKANQWVALAALTNTWLTQGNAGTDTTTYFIGTTDNQSLVFRTNNTKKMVLTNDGNVGIGNTTPSSKLTVNGSLAASANSLVSATTFNINNNDFYVSWNGTANGTGTLPQSVAGAGNFKGRIYYIKNTSTTYTLTITAQGSEKIDLQGANTATAISSMTLKPGETVNLINNGNTTGITWEVIGYLSAVDFSRIPGAVSKVYSAIGTDSVKIDEGVLMSLPGTTINVTLDQPSMLLVTYSAVGLEAFGSAPVQGSIDLVVNSVKHISSYYASWDAPSGLQKLGNYSTSQVVIDLPKGTHTIMLQARSWKNATIFNNNPFYNYGGGTYVNSDAKDAKSQKARVTIVVFNK